MELLKMNQKFFLNKIYLIWVIFLSAFIIPNVQSISVMSVDLGSEWMKIAIVSPGVPMEIILNTDSQRKTPLAVAFRDGERFIGDSALNVGIRFPEKTFTHFIDLLGKTSLQSESVKKYLQRFPYHRLIEQKIENDNGQQTTSIAFVLNDNGQELYFTPEELLSMMLKKAKHYAEVASAASSPSGQAQIITDCVLTVQPYFSQLERKSLKYAAQLAGLKVLQLINVNSAFALNYGVFRRKYFNSTNPTNILFYDMGAGSTLATIASYQLIKTKERGFTEIDPQLTIKAVAFDRYLGGFELQLRLRDHLLKLFSEQSKKTIEEIGKNKRAMAKLLKEAGRLKKVLSANNEHKAQIENVMDDIDLKTIVTREQFETMAEDLLNEYRITKPLNDVFELSGLQSNEIDSFIIIGGSTRIPLIQKLLQNYWSKELSKNINADEAGALGAAYQAAYLSKGFKVKTFHLKDWNIYQINVDFERETTVNNNNEENNNGKKLISRTLFARGNLFPQKKVLTFNKNRKDFQFEVNYVEPLIPQDSQKTIFKVALKNIENIFEKYNNFNNNSNNNNNNNSTIESKGIKVHFRMDQSGLLLLENSDVSFEIEYEEILKKQSSDDDNLEQISNLVGDAISKFGSKLSSLFANNNNNNDDNQQQQQEDNNETGNNNETLKNDTTTTNTTTSQQQQQQEEKSKKINETKNNDKESSSSSSKINVTEESSSSSSSSLNDSSSNVKNKTKNILQKELKKKIVKEDILTEIFDPFNNLKLTEKLMTESQAKLDAIDKREMDLLKRNQMKNTLESFIHETRDKLNQDDYSVSVTGEERESIEKELNKISEWLDYESDNSMAEDFEEKLKHLKNLTHDLFNRVQEYQNRPEALKQLQNVLNVADLFHSNAKNVSKEEQIFSDNELSTLRKVIDETKTWMDDSVKEQDQLPRTSNPLLTVTMIMEKITIVDREVNYLFNKARITPKKQPKKPTTTTNTNNTTPKNDTEKTEDSVKPEADSSSKKTTTSDDQQQEPPPSAPKEEEEEIKPEKTVEPGAIKTEL